MGEFLTRVCINPRINLNRDEFPFTLPVFREFRELMLHPDITFFVGENGSGKSTLLEAIAVNYGLPAEGGSKHHTFSTHDTHSELWDKIILAKPDYPKEAMFIRAETFYTFATYLEESGGIRYGDLHHRSRGQGFMETIAALKPPGLYLMDEPESALSVQGLITFLAQLKRLIDCGSQFIIATHSPILLGFGRGTIYEFTDDGIAAVEYKETNNYRLTLDFLKNRDRYAALLGLDTGPG